jgi:hypothetical protein
MAEDSSTLPNTRTGSPLPKVDTHGTDNENVTRVNSSDRKDVVVSEKAVDDTNAVAVNPDYILTGSKLALAHTGFLLLVFLYIRFILILHAIIRSFFSPLGLWRVPVPAGLATTPSHTHLLANTKFQPTHHSFIPTEPSSASHWTKQSSPPPSPNSHPNSTPSTN